MRSCLTALKLTIVTAILLTSLKAQTASYRVGPATSPYNPPGYLVGHKINKFGWIPMTDLLSGRPDQPLLWRWGRTEPLTLLGGDCGTAVGINDYGQIVGAACLPGETSPHAYFYKDKKAVDLGTFGGVNSAASAVNLSDQIAGTYQLNDGAIHGFSWQRKHWVDIGSLGGSFTYPYGINNSGVVTGQSDISNVPDPVYGIPPFHGFVWSAGTLTDIGSIFGSNFNYVYGINEAGVAVGSADLAGDVGAHTILWNNGTVQDLSPDGNISAGATSINNLGQVVGIWGSVDTDPADGPPSTVTLCPCYATLWQNGQEIFLNGLVSPEWSLLLALAIDDKGEILAIAQLNGGNFQTVVLHPILSSTQNAAARAIPSRERSAGYAGPRAFRRKQNGGFEPIW
jgi:probable HAF family extracellular repeat protein